MDAKLKHLESDSDSSLKFQSVSKNSVSVSEKAFPHDVTQDLSDVNSTFTDTEEMSNSLLCADKLQLHIFAANTKKALPDKSIQVLSSLEHPLAKYLSDLKIEPKFMTSTERAAETLSLNAKNKGQKAKFPHRWRLKTQVVVKNEAPTKEPQIDDVGVQEEERTDQVKE